MNQPNQNQTIINYIKGKDRELGESRRVLIWLIIKNVVPVRLSDILADKTIHGKNNYSKLIKERKDMNEKEFEKEIKLVAKKLRENYHVELPWGLIYAIIDLAMTELDYRKDEYVNDDKPQIQ